MCRKTLSVRIKEQYDTLHKRLITQFRQVSAVSTTADGWTHFSRAFLGVTVHWVDTETLERRSAMPTVERLSGRHTYDVLTAALEKIHQNFNIQNKVVSCVTDNGSNFVKAFTMYGMKMDDEKVAEESEIVEVVEMSSVLDEGVQEFHYMLPPHHRCAAHTLNLIAVKDSQKAEEDSVFKKIVRSSFARCQGLWNKQRSTVVADSIHATFHKLLVTPNATRWNSIYDSVKCLVTEIEKNGLTALDALMDGIGLSRFRPAELTFLREYIVVMKSVAVALNILQAEKKKKKKINMYIDYLLPTVKCLLRELRKKANDSALNPPEVPEVPKLKNRETENSEDCPPIPDKYKKKKKRKKKRVTICMTNCKYEVVRRVALKFGMREVAEDEFWDLYWTDLSVSVERAKVMKRFQKINHFPGMTEICRKDLLARNLNRMMKLFPKDYDFFPRTWCLPADLGEAQAYSRSKKNKTFICKPETGCQGRGIFLTKSLKDFTPNDRMICQVYLAKPFLIDGFKFDLRIYGLITSCDPLRIYIYNEGLARFATTRYREPTPTNISNVFMHLTNYAVNKHSRTFIKDVEAGSKRKISTLNEWLEKKEYDVGELWESIDDVIIKTVIAAHPILKHSYHACFPAHDVNFACFELLGFDVMLDYKLKPFVLEVNHSPSFHTDAPIDREVKESLLMDTFEILNLNHTDKRKMMEEDKKRVRERLLQGINGKESEQVNNVTLDVEDTYVSQIEWEQTHKGNFRLIYPAADQKKYQQFFHQNQGSLFQDTAASRAREECSRALREEIQQKAKAEAALRPVVNKKKDGDKQRPESPSIDTKNNSLKKKPSLPHLKKPVLDRKLQILNSFEPGTIDEIEERERVTAMAQRELLVKSFGILEHVYHILRKNNNLRPDDEKKYGLYGKLGCLQHLTSSYYMNSKLPAIFPQSVKAALPMRAGQNAINVHNHSLDDTNSAPTIERIADLGSDGIGDLGITCSHAPILMRPHLPRTLWMDESLGKESDIRFTKTHVARALSNTAKLQELEKREHRFCHNDNKA